MLSRLTQRNAKANKMPIQLPYVPARKGDAGRYRGERSGRPQFYMSHVKKWQMKINLVNELSVMKINICYILAEQVDDTKNFRLGGGMDSWC